MREIFSLLWQVVLDGLFPAFCLGCKLEGTFLCGKCLEVVPRLDPQLEFEVAEGAHFLDKVIAGSKFEEGSLLQRAIHSFKYDFLEDLAGPLGQLLFEAFLPVVSAERGRKFVLCPLPLHSKRRQWRGFNQSELLGLAVMKRLRNAGFANMEMAALLKRVHFLRPQMELDREQRIANMRGTFEVVGGSDAALAMVAKDAVVVLIDDIATTLSTLENAACVLKAVGVREVYGLVLARVF